LAFEIKNCAGAAVTLTKGKVDRATAISTYLLATRPSWHGQRLNGAGESDINTLGTNEKNRTLSSPLQYPWSTSWAAGVFLVEVLKPLPVWPPFLNVFAVPEKQSHPVTAILEQLR